MEDKKIVQFFGQYTHSVYRDEKTGKGTFFFETMQYPGEDCSPKKSIKRDVVTGKDVTWYQILCNSLNCPMPFYEKETPIKVTGYFDKPSEKYGVELKITKIEVSCNSEMSSIRYLTNFIPQKDAVKLVSKYGYSVFEFAEREDAPKAIENATDLTGAEAAKLAKELRRTVAERHLFEFLSECGIPFPYCLKAIKIYGQQAESYLRQNPFEIGTKIGLTYLQCQSIANASGMPIADEERIRAAAMEAIRRISANGHTYVDAVTFRTQFEKLAGKGVYEGFPTLTQAFPHLLEEIGTRADGRNIQFYSIELDRAEKRIAWNLLRIAKGVSDKHFDTSLISYAEDACQIRYGRQQRNAFQNMLSGKGVKILSGGPGTGKTTTLKGILLDYLRINPDAQIILCAPTGRAAQKMAESTGFPAMTIHRTIGYNPYNKEPAYRNSSNPIEADLVVVDESSMLEIPLFDMLLEAIKTGTSLFIMGDPDQLEAVGAGAILYDITHVNLPLFVETQLTEVFRQKGGSPIIENSRRINAGNSALVQHVDFRVINTDSPEESLERVKEIVKALHDPNDPFKLQVLSPAWKGVSGVSNLNKELQEILNPGVLPNGRKKKDIVYGGTRFRLGDKIIMMRNNYDVDYQYYNGDIGIITGVADGAVKVDIQGRELFITRALLDEMELSYAMTIHKSQGSDFPYVVVVLPQEPNSMLVRNLFYTGVTRAKKRVFVINEGRAMETAISRNKRGYRNTRLQEYLREMYLNIE